VCSATPQTPVVRAAEHGRDHFFGQALNGLRLRLTLLYTLAALALVALVGGGAYAVVASYFRTITDLALQHKMAHEFHALAAPIPPELVPADRDWSIVRGDLPLLGRPAPGAAIDAETAVRIAATAMGGRSPERVRLRSEDGRSVYELRYADGSQVLVEQTSGRILAIERHDDEDHTAAGTLREAGRPTAAPAAYPTPRSYDAELAAIFVLPLDYNGRVLFDPNTTSAPLAPDRAALSAALASGHDLRSVTTADGQRVRLLTYRLTRDDGPAALQLGRMLGDQERVLAQLTIGLLGLGTLSMALIGAGSWWLAGRALRPAQAAWERQQRFIASASHELRTPLTLIRASAEVALRGVPAGDADQRELLADVLAESDHMRQLVDDLLTLSRLDSQHLPIRLAPVDLPLLLAEVQRQAARLGAERGISVTLGAVSGTVRADPDRLRQVLIILLDNALRYTPAGGQITLAAVPDGQSVQLSVADTGCGIAPEHLPHIFERFYRVDAARGRESGNAGLGLAIARGLVEVMGGSIGAESAVGQGTTIWLRLPAGR